ncbi:O-antigen ligase family protein [Vulcanococcus sp.]|jgi:O-antigen ligase|uniref:O-antigen ligase family protein n=1 Tax=Vulcanococcus sp. TaxID=2856995 RepID=UPI0037D9F135
MTLTRRIGIVTPLVLALAIASTGLMQEGERLSAALSLSWVVLSIGQQAVSTPGSNRLWPVAVLAILLLNVRGMVLGESPRPVSHVDYVLLIAAVLAGNGLHIPRWRTTLSGICLTVASCGLWQATTVWQHLTGSEIGYRLGFLLINQTALLAGLGCVSGLAALQLWRTPQAARAQRGIQLALALGSGGCAVMTLATHSRAGVGLIPISLLIAWAVQQGTQHRRKLGGWLRRRGLVMAVVVTLLIATPLVWLASPQGPSLRQNLAALYGTENRTSDAGRLALWRCYASLPLSGNNRLIYGVGYGRARELCPIRLPGRPKPLSHAHNLPLQVWAEAGSLGLAMLLIGALLLARRVVKKQHTPQAMALTAPLLYGLLFNLFELGMLKVPLLTVLFGAMLSGALIRASNGGATLPSSGGSAAAKAEAP